MDWSTHFPAYIKHTAEDKSIDENTASKGTTDEPSSIQEPTPKPLTKPITIADIGCGFGGLLVALSPLFPNDLILGLEIRAQVTEYVHDRILALRAQHQKQQQSSQLPPTTTTTYQNISPLRTNSMKFLPNLFHRAQLQHIFFCFPDPHFKQRKHKMRIVSDTLAAEYAYVLKEGGYVWCVTDVEELAGWMRGKFEAFGKVDGSGSGAGQGLFEKVDVPEEGREDEWPDRTVGIMVRCMREETEEGKKVGRNGGRKFVSVFRRRRDPPWPGEEVEVEEMEG